MILAPVLWSDVPKTGTIIPNMGTQQTVSPIEALFSEVQGRVLALLFGHPERRYQGAELIRAVAGGTGATHRVLQALVEAELVTVTPVGNQRHYQANAASPVFDELRRLMLKSSALAEPLAAALRPFAGEIEEAFVYGSVANGTATAESDVDLLVISDSLEYAALYDALAVAEETIGRKIEPVLVTRSNWTRKLKKDGGFARRVMDRARIPVLARRDGDG